MQHLDTDIDLNLDDDTQLVYEVNHWAWLFNGALLLLLLPTVAVMWADLTGREGLIGLCVVAFVALVAVAGFALAMQYRADHR